MNNRFVSVCAGISAGFIAGWCVAIVVGFIAWRLGLRPDVPEIGANLDNIGDIFQQVRDGFNAIVRFIRLVIVWFVGLPIVGAVAGGATGFWASRDN